MPTLTPAGLAHCDWTDWSTGVRVVVTDPAALTGAASEVRRLMERVALAASRFRPDSELSRLAAAGGRPVAVGDLLWQLLTAALRAARHSDGRVDPTVGPALAGLGYDRTISAVRDDGGTEPVQVRTPVGWQRIVVDDTTRTVTLPAGAGLDLGATAKAWTADAAAARVAALAGCGALVAIGGDVAVAGEPPPDGWVVRVVDDHASPDTDGQQVCVHAGGLATSSITTRTWLRGGYELHHIVDPATGLPSRGPWRTVSVAAASCVDANTASTAALVLGATAPSWLRDRQLPARLVHRDGSTVVVAGWPREER